uniref:Uncharacterized protein n=1 Tax=Syphacia muris TaxID=451379 RepID=A0A0N5A9K0_9BILA
MSRKLLTKLFNRNPRNLEMLGLQPKPLGYELDLDRLQRSFIYKTRLLHFPKYMKAELLHYKDGVVIDASTKENEIATQLYRFIPVTSTLTLLFMPYSAAALNIGRVLAMRCLMSGIHCVSIANTEHEIQRSQHLRLFYEGLKEEGLLLGELPHIEHEYKNDRTLTYDDFVIRHNKRDKTDE